MEGRTRSISRFWSGGLWCERGCSGGIQKSDWGGGVGGCVGEEFIEKVLLDEEAGQDPMHTVRIAPVYAWAMEAWRRKESLSVVKVAWRRVRWRFDSAFEVVSDAGEEDDNLTINPKAFLRRLH